MTAQTNLCVDCGGPRNHFVDGVPQKRCSKCNDRRILALPRVGSTLLQSKRGVRTLGRLEMDLLRQIDDLLDDESYAWASDTLTGIRETVERTGTATDGQRRAVQNIEDARAYRRSRR